MRKILFTRGGEKKILFTKILKQQRACKQAPLNSNVQSACVRVACVSRQCFSCAGVCVRGVKNEISSVAWDLSQQFAQPPASTFLIC